MDISRESIFTSAIRSLFNAFFAVLGIVVCFVVVGLVYAFTTASSSALATKTQLSIEPDASGNKDLLPITSPAILKIDIHGIVGDKKLSAQGIQSILMDSRDGLLKNNRVKGILLHVNTPGGGVTDSNGIYEVLKEYKEKYNVPIYAFVDGMCASGGMYITSSADKIYASSVSIMGSIGVILGPALNFYDLMQKYGIQSKMITRGKDKAMLNPFTQWTKDQGSSLEPVCEYLYQHFVDLVVLARKNMDKEKLINDYGAQVYSSLESEKLGYIEVANSTYNQALKDLVKEVGLNEGDHYQVVQLKPIKSIFSDLLDAQSFLKTGKIEHQMKWSKDQIDELSDPFLYLYQP